MRSPGELAGLSTAEAAARLAAEGPNELLHRRFWQIALEVLSEPMLLLLFAAGAIYLSLGDLGVLSPYLVRLQ